jgi:hypothetical protein
MLPLLSLHLAGVAHPPRHNYSRTTFFPEPGANKGIEPRHSTWTTESYRGSPYIQLYQKQHCILYSPLLYFDKETELIYPRN